MDNVDGTVVWRKNKFRTVTSTTHASSKQPRRRPQPQGTGLQHELQGNALARHALNEATVTLCDASKVNVESFMDLIGHAHKLGPSDNTACSQGSHLSYWAAYLPDTDTTDATFNLTHFMNNRDEVDVRRREHDTLYGFACYVVCKPRQKNKAKNRADYARVVVGTVRTFYFRKTGRWPVLGEDRANSTALKIMFKGLKKFSPNMIQQRLLVMHHHLRAIKPVMDLENSHLDSTLWELWLFQ